MPPITLKYVAQFLVRNWKDILYGIEMLAYFVNLKKEKPMKPSIEILIEKLVKLIDDNTDTGIIDVVDQFAFKKLFKLSWKMFEDDGNPELVKAVTLLADSIISGDDTQAIEYLTAYINGKVDAPNLDELEEAKIIESALITVALLLRGLLKKKELPSGTTQETTE